MGGGRGGRNKARTQRKHFAQSRENVWKRPKSDDNSESNGNKSGWEPFATQNPAFVDYYKEQGIVTAEEWDTFMECLHKPLPAAFRVNSSGPFCDDIRLQLENDFMKSLEFEVTDEGENNAIRPLPWYPENLAWHSNYSRMQLRKNKTLERFHEFLKLENEIGNITRQEAVSMVPPLFLDVCPDHFVLDMCAAPGSKTFQLLEIIHKSNTSGPGLLPSGMIIANDVDVQRSNLLIHQTKRMCTANLIVTNHEAQHFPGCRLNRCLPSPTETEIIEDSSLNQLIFDRVLCDVPCSGDGTLRKAPDIWRKWNSGIGSGFHGLQLKIALRGLALLKVGGRMVYSTCSMNPIENEAVVAEILRRCAGSVELVDVSHELPDLVRRPGLKKWKVCDKGTWSASYKDVPQSRRGGIVPSMFPSGRSHSGSNADDTNLDGRPENGHSMEIDRQTEDNVTPADALDEEVSELPLERCIRIVPHDQNSGAFFIAVLHKVSSLPVTAIQEKSSSRHGNPVSKKAETCEKPIETVVEETKGDVLAKADDTGEKTTVSSPVDGVPDSNLCESVVDHDTSVAPEDTEQKEAESLDNSVVVSVKPGEKRKLQMQGRWKGVDPVLFFNDETIVSKIQTFYGINESFPLKGHLISRNSDNNHVKRLYYVSESVKDVLQLNLLAGQQLKIASVGLKMFERQTSKEGSASPCAFRISSEGLPLILPYITKQILYGSLVDFKHLLQYKSIKFADFVDAEFGEKASKLMMGCCVVVLRTDNQPLPDSNKSDASTITIGCWRGRGSLTVMVTAIECQEMLERLAIRLEPEKKESADQVVQPGPVDGTEIDTADVEKIEDEDTNCGDLS